MSQTWLLPGAVPTGQSVTSDWEFINRPLIEGVRIKEVRHVPTSYGYVTELFRLDWKLDEEGVSQAFQGTFLPGNISAWHAHEDTIDRLFINSGQMRVVLYDARSDSPTKGMINEFVLGTVRPGLLHVPPKVWHGVHNIGNTTASLVNFVNEAYRYDDPDHYHLPWDSAEIPYRFRC